MKALLCLLTLLPLAGTLAGPPLAARDPETAFALEMDFLALLKKDPEGRWQMLDWGFSGDIGVYESFQADYPSVPWFLLP